MRYWYDTRINELQMEELFTLVSEREHTTMTDILVFDGVAIFIGS